MSRRLRVVRVFKDLKAGGGVQTRLKELLPRLADSVEVRVLCYRGKGPQAEELEAAGIPVDLIPLGPKWAPWVQRRYVRYFQELRPDVVHCHSYTANTFAVVAAAVAGVPVRLRHIHTYEPLGGASGARLHLRRWVDRAASRLADATLTVSEAARQRYLAVTGAAPRTCRVLYNGLDLLPFRSCREQRAELRRCWGAAEATPVVGLVGRLAGGKGHEDFLQAAARVLRQIPEARFVLAGDGPLRERLEDVAASLGLNGRLALLGHRDDVAAVLGALDLFVFPSSSEGLPGVAIEAQAAGLPVVAYDIPVMKEVVLPNESATLVPCGDVTALSAAVVRWLRDEDGRSRASQLAREHSKRFSLEGCAAETVALYREFVGRRGPVASGAER